MQQYNSLWRKQQKVIFDLGNLVDDKYTGVYYTKLTATFFTVADSTPTADTILPISKMSSGADEPSAFRIPEDAARVSHKLPSNVNRAVVSLAACGQDTEEFWFANVLDSICETFSETSGPLDGGGPWREVQLLIDGILVGVVWPFPIVFTGGVNPGLWRPVVGIDAFDLREQEIEITPWLPKFLDGNSHSFEIKVVDLVDDGKSALSVRNTPGSNWVVTGKIFLFLDDPGSVTSGISPMFFAPAPQISTSWSLTKNSTGANETLSTHTSASRQISISGLVTTQKGTQAVAWSQSLQFENTNTLSAFGLKQHTNQLTTLSAFGPAGYGFSAVYPLDVGTSMSGPEEQNLTIHASISRGLKLSVSGPAIFPNGVQPTNQSDMTHFRGSTVDTHQNGEAAYFADNVNNVSSASGSLAQQFSFRGLLDGAPGKEVELYSREVRAVNGSVLQDRETYPG